MFSVAVAIFMVVEDAYIRLGVIYGGFLYGLLDYYFNDLVVRWFCLWVGLVKIENYKV